MKPLRWGILGTGAIARRYAKAVRGSRSGVLSAVGSRDLATAEAFAAEFGPVNAYGDYASVVNDPDVDAVYIARPHPMHADWSIRAARVGCHILCEKPAAMNWADTLGNMKVLDAWRKEVGVRYEAEDWTKMKRPLGHDRPERLTSSGMTFGRIPGLSKPMARLVMGGVSSPSIGGQIALYAYFELGGNAFDSAYISTKTDAALGHWISSRGVMDEVVVIAKGGLTPHCTPEGIVRELEESLRDLGMDQADIYIMHRDNPDVPVGEFVDLMNRLRGQGLLEGRTGRSSGWKRPTATQRKEACRASGF